MRKMIFLLIIALMLITASTIGFADTIVVQTSGGIQAYDGNAPVVVDNSVIVTGDSIEDAKVAITNFNSGDVLGYNASLPSGVSASYDATKGILTFTGTTSAAKWQILLRTVTFSGDSIGEREIVFSIGNAVKFKENEHFYEYIDGKLSWFQANEAASNRTLYGLKGYLATINSSDENDYIVSILGNDAWIGASDDYTLINSVVDVPYVDQNAAEGLWYWVTGPEAGQKFSIGNETPVTEPGQYSNWNIDEPNNNMGNEHYASIFEREKDEHGRLVQSLWNDGALDHTNAYIVEYGGMNGDPDIILHDSRTIVTPPAPPSSITALAWNEGATVSFIPPSNNGGSFVTSYTVTASPGSISATGSGTSIAITGLTNGTPYTFTVTATNIAGTSAESSISNTITPNPSGSTPSSWAQTEVDEARGKGLVLAEADDYFQNEIRRELFCRLLVNLVEQTTKNPVPQTIVNPFQDTDNSDIIKAYQLGIVNGISDTEFGPEELITREQVAAMIMRTARKLDEEMNQKYTSVQLIGDANFADLDLISNWALQDIREANMLGIIKGVGNNKIDPKGNTTVEQSLLLVLRVFNEYLTE